MCSAGLDNISAFASVPQRVLLMDEISTGLDSATTYTVTDYLRTTTHYLHLTTLVSLLQPPPEVLCLWDTLCLSAHLAAPGQHPLKRLATGALRPGAMMQVYSGC